MKNVIVCFSGQIFLWINLLNPFRTLIVYLFYESSATSIVINFPFYHWTRCKQLIYLIFIFTKIAHPKKVVQKKKTTFKIYRWKLNVTDSQLFSWLTISPNNSSSPFPLIALQLLIEKSKYLCLGRIYLSKLRFSFLSFAEGLITLTIRLLRALLPIFLQLKSLTWLILP